MPEAVPAVPVETPAAPAPADPAGAAPTPPAPPATPESARDGMAERFARLAREQKAIAAEKQKLSEERRKAEAAALNDPGSYLRRVYGDDWYDRLTQYKLEGEKRAPADMAVQALREDL